MIKCKKAIALLSLCICMSACSKEPGSREFSDGHTHEWGPWEVLEVPTCSKTGIKAHVCELCGEEREETMPIYEDAHKWVFDQSSDVEATCSNKGIKGSKICSYCGFALTGEIVEKLEHDWEYLYPQPEGFVEATCCNEGRYFCSCKECGAISEPMVEPRLPHDLVINERNSEVLYEKCEDCDYAQYRLFIEDAEGWNKVQKMDAIEDPNNTSTWTFDNTDIPAGNYDLKISAVMCHKTDGNLKYYNMSKPGLASDEDMRVNNEERIGEVRDTPEEADYRYTAKINGVAYSPTTTENWEDLGFEADDHTGRYRICSFIDNVTISEGTNTVSLIHNNINTPLIIRAIYLTKRS